MRRVAEEHAERHNSTRDELLELEKKHDALMRSRDIGDQNEDEKIREMNRLEREIETLKTLHEVRLKRHLGDLSVSHQEAQIETENRHAKKLEMYKSNTSRLESELEQAHWDLNISSAAECNVSTEMDRLRKHHQTRHDEEMEVVRELKMQLITAEERERSEARELILDHENSIEELREAHQGALQHHISTETDRLRKHHQTRHDKEMEVVRELKMQLITAEERERSEARELILDHENSIEELREVHQGALQHHISTETDRLREHHQTRYGREMEVVRELKMQLSMTTQNDYDNNKNATGEEHWKSRALELEKALREAKSLGERAFSEIQQIQSTQQEQLEDESKCEILESEIEDLKRQRASQVYEMGQNRIRFAMDSRRRNDVLQIELASLKSVRQDARNASLRRCLNSVRSVYLRRAWQQWRGVIRWCHYAWFQERAMQFRLSRSLLVMDGVARSYSLRLLSFAFRVWQRNQDESSESIVLTATPLRSTTTCLTPGFNTPSSDNDAIRKLHAIQSAMASQEKQRTRRKIYYRFLHASHLLNSAKMRRRQRRLISAFHRWVYASRYYYLEEDDEEEEFDY